MTTLSGRRAPGIARAFTPHDDDAMDTMLLHACKQYMDRLRHPEALTKFAQDLSPREMASADESTRSASRAPCETSRNKWHPSGSVEGTRTDGEATFKRLVTRGHSPRLHRLKHDLIWDSLWSSPYPSTTKEGFKSNPDQSFSSNPEMRSTHPISSSTLSTKPFQSTNGSWRRRRFHIPLGALENVETEEVAPEAPAQVEERGGFCSRATRIAKSLRVTRKVFNSGKTARFTTAQDAIPCNLALSCRRRAHGTKELDAAANRQRNFIKDQLQKNQLQKSNVIAINLTNRNKSREDTESFNTGNATDQRQEANLSKIITRKTWSPSVMWKLAHRFNIEVSTVRMLWQLFLTYGRPDDGILEPNGFQMLLSRLLRDNYKKQRDIPRHVFKLLGDSGVSTLTADGAVDFISFLEWYSIHAFTKWFCIRDSQVTVRELARKHHVSLVEAERIETEFRSHDLDDSGYIDYEEFVNMMLTRFNVKEAGGLSNKRLAMFWKQIDTDNSGHVEFSEYFAWYVAAFGFGEDFPPQKYYQMMRPQLGKRCE